MKYLLYLISIPLIAQIPSGSIGGGGGSGSSNTPAVSANSLYLKLNDGSGTTPVDSSGNSRSCTFGTSAQTPTWANNPRGVSFNGSQVIICASSAPDWGASIKTVHIFAAMDVITARAFPVGAGNHAYFTLYGDANVSVSLDFWNARESILGVYEGTYESSIKSDGLPHDYAVVFGAPPVFYIDGKQSSGSITATASKTPGATGGSVFIGAAGSNGIYGFPGTIYSVLMKTTTDTAATVGADYGALAYDLKNTGVNFGPIQYSGACIIFDGDSWTTNDHNGKIYNTSLISAVSQRLGMPFNAWNFSINGWTFQNTATRVGSPYTDILSRCANSNLPPIADTRFGYNDLFLFGRSAATVYGDAQTYLQARVGQGFGVVAHTVLACANAGFGCASGDAARLTYNNSLRDGLIAGTLVTTAPYVAVDYAGFDPVLGINGVTQNNSNFWTSDQYHISPDGNIWIADYDAEAILRAYNSQREICSTITIDTPNDGTIWRVAKNGSGNGKAANITAGLTQSLAIKHIGAGYKLTKTELKTTTAFAGPTTMTVKIGDSVGGVGYYDNNAYDVEAAVSNTNYQIADIFKANTWAGSNITLDFTTTVGNLTTITAGVLKLNYCIAPTSIP